MRRGLSADTVGRSLAAVFSDAGLDRLKAVHFSAREVSLSTGGARLSVPLHPGAETFWREHGYEYREAAKKP